MDDDAFAFTEDDRDSLVLIVKNAHQLGWKGSKGEWTDFLAATGSSGDWSDPDRQNWQILADFVRTLENADVVKSLRRWRRWILNHRVVESNDPWAQTPEQRLVDRTYESPKFYSSYQLPSFLPGWKRTNRGSSLDASKPERLLSVDCEMVLCEGNEQQVVQVCVVDRNLETVLDTLVKPSKRVIDYITHIHGIGRNEIQQATCTQDEIQRKIYKLLKPGTILVGHSVFNDLRAMKIDHRRVIDTSMLFKRHGSGLIGLHQLCKFLLGYDFRESGMHKCIDDAIVPMKITLLALEKKPEEQKFELYTPCLDPCRLLIHKISHPLSNEEMKNIVSATIPCSFESVRGKQGQTHAIFETKELANKAFDLISGEIAKDSCGCDQKAIALWKKGLFVQLRVRKLVRGDGLRPLKRPREPPPPPPPPPAVESKRLKQQREEIERLTEKFEASKAEILALRDKLRAKGISL